MGRDFSAAATAVAYEEWMPADFEADSAATGGHAMKRGQKHAPQPKPAPAPAPVIQPHIAPPLSALPSDDDGIRVSFTCPGCGKPIGGGCWGCDGSRDTAASGPTMLDRNENIVPLAMVESMPEDLSVACAALGLASEHVLTHAIRGDGSVSIITRGGARLAWPCSEEQRQAALALTDQQRDGLIRDGEGNILPRGKWLTTPHKF